MAGCEPARASAGRDELDGGVAGQALAVFGSDERDPAVLHRERRAEVVSKGAPVGASQAPAQELERALVQVGGRLVEREPMLDRPSARALELDLEGAQAGVEVLACAALEP